MFRFITPQSCMAPGGIRLIPPTYYYPPGYVYPYAYTSAAVYFGIGVAWGFAWSYAYGCVYWPTSQVYVYAPPPERHDL